MKIVAQSAALQHIIASIGKSRGGNLAKDRFGKINIIGTKIFVFGIIFTSVKIYFPLEALDCTAAAARLPIYRNHERGVKAGPDRKSYMQYNLYR